MTNKAVAKLAGVSESTVSKALSGSREISAETAERIRRIAAENGVIRPTYNKEKPKRKVAIIVPEIISFQYSRMVTALIGEIRKNNMEGCVYITDFQDKVFCNVMEWILQDEGMCGIITLDELRTKEIPKLPMVVIQPLNAPEFDTVYEDMAYFLDILKYLLSLGHRSIGYIGEKNTFRKDRAFLEAAAALELTIPQKHIFISGKRFEEIGMEAAQYFCTLEDRPTAIVTAYDEIAYGAMTVFQKKNIRIPEDISITGVNNIPTAAHMSVPLTTVHTYNEAMMQMAVKMLMDRIENPRNHVIWHTLVNCPLVIRESTGKLHTDK